MVSIHSSPYGIVEDLYACEGQDDELNKAKDLIQGGSFRTSLEGDVLRIMSESELVQLRVEKVLGGNQWNVLQNLRVLQDLFQSVNVDVKSYPDEDSVLENIQRQTLHLPGDLRLRLSMPNSQDSQVLTDIGNDEVLFISSAGPYSAEDPYWAGVDARSKSGGRWYWNPTRSDLTGSLPSSFLESISGQIDILQMNEEEARSWQAHYGKFPNADWTVVTLGERGALIRDSEGNEHVVGIARLRNADEMFGELLVKNPVGCGDAFLASLIFARERGLDLSPKDAGSFASVMSALQFHHRGSNLSAIKSLLLSRESTSIKEFERIAA